MNYQVNYFPNEEQCKELKKILPMLQSPDEDTKKLGLSLFFTSDYYEKLGQIYSIVSIRGFATREVIKLIELNNKLLYGGKIGKWWTVILYIKHLITKNVYIQTHSASPIYEITVRA